jgi:tRNA (mo5U34)-methyltransferase
LVIFEVIRSPEELQAQVEELGWFHSIDLGNGVTTPGLSDVQLSPDQLPDFIGKSVLDIGAWDGYYSFLAERNGAARVVSMDHYAWGVGPARDAYWRECFERGVLPDHSRDTTEFWQPELFGKRAFDLARSVLNSKVEPVVADFMSADLDSLGTFDVVLCLGVLYHMKEPLTCLERVRKVTGTVAAIETLAIHLDGFDHDSLLQFHAGGEVQGDFGNWFVPTIGALQELCRAAGFSEVKVIAGPPGPVPSAVPTNEGRSSERGNSPRLDTSDPPKVPTSTTSYRALVHAFV